MLRIGGSVTFVIMLKISLDYKGIEMGKEWKNHILKGTFNVGKKHTWH